MKIVYRNVVAQEVLGLGWDFFLYGTDDPDHWIWVGAIAYPLEPISKEEIESGLKKWIDNFIESAVVDVD